MLRPITLALLVLLCGSPADAQHQPRRRVQVGLASFYGAGFNGDRTASGEVFDQRKLVAASRTLPLGSIVRVTNLENGRRVVLRIIDRGPFGRNRRKGGIIDVSKATARQLGFTRDGLSRVRVEVIRWGETAIQSKRRKTTEESKELPKKIQEILRLLRTPSIPSIANDRAGSRILG